jgi:hypothetical protein
VLKATVFLTVAELNNDGLKKFTCSRDEHHERIHNGALNTNANQSDQPIDVMRRNRARRNCQSKKGESFNEPDL